VKAMPTINLQWFKNITKLQSFLLITGSLVFLLLITLGSLHTWNKDFSLLFSQLNPQDAATIIKQLEEEQIDYRLTQQGQAIHIATHLVDKTRLKILSKGMQFSGNIGFELFDKNDFGMTDFSQKINFQRALQGELERTINSLDEVQHSRVHLVFPENRLFQQNQHARKASVTLHVRTPLTRKQIASIQQLIQASVPNLEAKAIVLIDQQGNLLSTEEEALDNRLLVQKKNQEKYLTDKITSMLYTLFEPGQFIVQVDLTLNHDQRELESVKPDTQGMVIHERETHHIQAEKSEKSSSNKNITREKSYQAGTVKEHFVQASGTIQRVSLGVLLPIKTSPEQVELIANLVKSIAGFEEKRGDNIQVVALIPEKIPQDFTTPSLLPDSIEINSPDDFWNQTAMVYAKWFLIGIAALSIGIRHTRIKQKRRQLLQELTTWLTTHAQ